KETVRLKKYVVIHKANDRMETPAYSFIALTSSSCQLGPTPQYRRTEPWNRLGYAQRGGAFVARGIYDDHFSGLIRLPRQALQGPPEYSGTVSRGDHHSNW